mmetsp:Transcript_45742/g.92332  ORF Transcript_45742/g.92332 Transcript_45742/m.92332 type:complete len:970 (-) Transcript_45742:129-3038(-)
MVPHPLSPERDGDDADSDDSNECFIPTSQEAKEIAVYFTDRAHIKFKFGFEDLMVVVTLFVLFGDDFRILLFDKSADTKFVVLISISFVIFLFEFLIHSWSKTTIYFNKPSAISTRLKSITRGLTPHFSVQGYLFGFYFWLDFLAVVSVFPDIPWIANPLGIGALSAGVSSDVGATARLARVARMVRLVRLVKLYKAGKMRIEAQKRDLELSELMMKGIISPKEYQERQQKNWTEPAEMQSKVGAELSDTTTKRVIAIVLLMLCFVPLLSVTVTNRAPEAMMSSIQNFNEQHDTWNLLATVVEVRSYFEVATPRSLPEQWSQPFLVYLEVYPSYPDFEMFGCHNATPTWQNPSGSIGSPGGNLGQASVCLRKEEWVGGGQFKSPRAVRNANDIDEAKRARLRSSEVLGEESHQREHEGIHYSKDCCLSAPGKAGETCESIGACYVRYKFNMKVEMMDSALLSIITTTFVAFMLVIGANTFIADAERLVLLPIQEIMESVKKVSDDPSRPIDPTELSHDGGGQYETRQIANAIKKITDLLRIGFGVAGSEIVRENLSAAKGSGSEGGIDLMKNPGKRIYSVFGFCMIEDFDHVTEKLGDEIMDFVNDVASVVHENVSVWGGQCNKNLGGSFLMTWKVPELYTNGSHSSIDVSRIPYIAKVADRALIGFLKVIAELNRDKRILAYRKRKDLYVKDEHTGEMIPFKVRMGFGLHIGWGIEGPVGSTQKVDATYLSPHVNMAARCETAAKQWDVPLLCTDVFYSCLSKAAQKNMRQVDKVMVKGSEVAMSMYTFDAFQDQQMIRKEDKRVWGVHGFEKYTQHMTECYDPDTTSLFEQDPDLVRLRRHVASDGYQNAVKSLSPNSRANPLIMWLQVQHSNPTMPIEEQEWMSDIEIPLLHGKGVKKYLEGEWIEARDIFRLVDHLVSKRKKRFGDEDAPLGDGPSHTLLSFMGEWGFIAPANWDPSEGRSLVKK